MPRTRPEENGPGNYSLHEEEKKEEKMKTIRPNQKCINSPVSRRVALPCYSNRKCHFNQMQSS